MKITKGMIVQYKEIRKSGEFNMIKDAAKVIAKMGITIEEYKEIASNYSRYVKRLYTKRI